MNRRISSIFTVLLLLQGCGELPVVQIPDVSGVEPTELDLVIGVMRKHRLREFEPDYQSNEEGIEFIGLDLAFLADYEVIEILKGNYSKQRIQFDAYDHWGVPSFAEYDTVLLYLVKRPGRITHLKGQFLPVYEVRGGGWAVCGETLNSEDIRLLAPEPLRLVKAGPLNVGDRSRAEIRKDFPARYFRHSRGEVYCTHGNLVQDIVQAESDLGTLPFQDH